MLGNYPPILWIFIFGCVSISAQFINFKKGYEYLYKYDSTANVKSIGNFHVLAKIGYINIKDVQIGQEIFVRVYNFQLKTKHSDDVIDHQTDFSKWFSFVISPQGEITAVYHPDDDDDEAVALKKGAAAMFASRLHQSEEISSRPTDEGWTYSVRELGHEGEHNATYTVRNTGEGHVFKKVRHPGHHPVKHATSEYTKTLHFDRDLGNIHTVLVQEKVKALDKPAEGYNPFENTRPVQAVNNFTQMDYPELSAHGTGKLEFLTRHKIDQAPKRPDPKLMTSSIHIKNVKEKKIPVHLNTYLEYIKGNLTCMREEPEKGSKKLDSCFTHLGFALRDLSDHQLFDVAKQYLLPKPKLTRTFQDRNHMLDAIGSMTTEVSQRILLDLVLNISRPDPFLVKRTLVHLVNLDGPPVDDLITKLTTLCFDPSSSPPDLQRGETYHRVVLTVGVVANRLWDAGRKAESTIITEKLENLLGLHDPWQYRKKRSIFTEEEMLNDDRWRVILIGSLGNAGLDQSYEMIVSHINTTNSQWVKRAGIHALRKYRHEKAAHMMLRTALYDDDSKVRYEALLQYQAHPKAALVAPRDKYGGSVNGSIFYMDPRDVGIHDIEVHDRHRRDDDKGLSFNLASPSVDWKKMLGSTTIGASFGLTINNALLFKIAPLSGHMKVNVHDEAYARIHLGFLGQNLDFFLARVCFKGGAEYNLNMLQEFDITSIKKLVELYDSIKGQAVGAVSGAIELFRDIIKGEFSLTDMIEDFKQALEDLPEKVVAVGKKAVDAMEMLGELEETELPPFVRPARNLVIKVSNLYKEVKTNVLSFYNQLMETVTIIIPRAGKVIFKAIQAIINGFKTFNKDPKQAISTVAGNVINIGLEVTNLIQAVNKTRNALNQLKENPPEWMDLTEKVGEILELGVEAAKTLAEEGQEWVEDVVSGQIDPIEEFSKGKVTLADQKQEVVRLLKEIVNDVLSPLDALKKLGGKFIETYQKVNKIITDIKDAYNSLKEGYRTARSLIDRVFGPKCHKDFPRTIRQPGGGCGWSGDFKAEGSKYEHEGMDVTISEGKTIVAPFEGNIMLSDSPNEVIIVPTGGSLKNTEIIITNIKPNSSIQSPADSTYVDSAVSAGQPIGEAYGSPCAGNSHVHFSMKRDGGYIDPTRYLEPRIPDIPKWIQECDDYKLVFKFELLAEDCLVCLNKKENDTSPERKGEEVENPETVDEDKDPSAAADQENNKPDSFFQKMKSSAPAVQDKAEKTKDKPLKTLFKKASAFMKKFSIRNLKMGTILDLLEILGLDDSMDKMADVIKTIRDMISNKPCFNPHQLTDDQLRSELIDRQLQAEGSREDMIKVLTTPSNSCPLMKIGMPDNIYCTFDDKCLGLECCAHFKLFMFRKTYKVFARFDPCDFQFHIGAGGFNKSYGLLDGLGDINGGFEKKVATGIELDILGGIELVFNLKLEKDNTAALLTVGVGFCSQDDHDNCIAFFNILDEAVTPLPICHPDGTMTWPEVDYKSLFDKESIKNRIREGAKQFVKDAAKKGLEELVNLIPCVSPDAPGKTEPCPRPERFTLEVLKKRLENRGLATTGIRTQLEQRLTQAHKSCSILDFDITLPTINNEKVNKLLYMQIAPNCLRFDACFDVNITIFNFSKTLNAYIDLDPCRFTLTLNLEDCTETRILLGYDWGVQKELDLKGVVIKYKIDRDLTKKVFKVDMGLKVQLGDAEPIMDAQLLENLEVPIPICNENFSLPGSGSLRELAEQMGGKLIKEVVDVVFKQLGLDKIFLDGKCTVPPEPDCPWSLPDYKKLLPNSFKDNVNCTLPENCFGVQCCVGFVFDVPLFEEPLVKNVPFFMKFEPCNFTVELGFGTYYHKEVLLTYNWGTETTLEIGSGDPAPIIIKFTVSKYPQGFILYLHVSTCIPIDGANFCYPQGGMQLLDGEKIPACDANALVEFSKQNFSLSNWLDDLDIDLSLQSLSQAAAQMLLDRFGISEYLLDERCDVTHPPYIPSVDGWRNECPKSTFNLPRLPRGLHCHLADTCTKITCCFDVPFLDMSFNAVLDVDMCYYTINATIEKKSVFIHMLGENTDITAGVSGEVDIVDVFKFNYGLKKKQERIVLDLDLEVCFEKDTCLEEFEVLKGTEVPQLICDLDAKWNLRNFSLADWAKARGQDLGEGLLRSAVDLLLEQLGIKNKMLSPPCDRNSLKYQPAESGNWKSDCELTKSALNLPPINLPANCYLNDKCLGIDCCLYTDLLDLSLHASFNIDLCNFIIEGSIEKYSFRHVILDYSWGTEEEATLDGVPVMKINYKIDRLLSQQVFIVDLSVSLCLEGDECGFELKVMDQSRLPMPGCAKFTGFKIPDFSLSDWLREKGGEITAQLSALLLEQLGIDHFLLDQQCQNYLDPYRTAVNGWNNECPDIVLPSLPDGVTCHVTDYCTGITCCAEVPQIRRNFNAYLYLDSCNYNIRVGIEKLEFTHTLFDYEWGKPEVMDLGGIFRIEYTITEGEKCFLVDLSLKVCLTANEECKISIPIFVGLIVPKPFCDWEATMQLTDFSLSEFVKEQGEILKDRLSEELVEKVLDSLGVSPYLLDSQCSLDSRPDNGWTSACPKTIPFPPLPTSLSCSVPEHCTGVDCCLDLPLFSRNVHFTVDLDMCRMELTLAIEKLEFKTLLFKYQWGKPASFHLKKIFRADYIIDKLEGDKQFVLSLNISVCLEAGKSCLVSVPVLSGARFPNPVCDWNSTLSLRGFSLSDWLAEQKLAIGQSLSSALRFQLAVSLGISQYLLDPMCSRQQTIYLPDTKGWNNACPKSVPNLPALPSSLTCHIPDYCTGLDCCVHLDGLGWSFNFRILLDTRNYLLTIGIEKLVFSTTLFDYDWGKWEFFNLNGVVRLGFKIEDLHHAWKYLLSVKLSLCLESSKPCELEFPVLTDISFPKLVWNWENPFSLEGNDFSLKTWLSQMNLPSAADIAGIALAKLLDKTGLSMYLADPQCDRGQSPFAGAVAGWKKECPANIALPTLPPSVTCHLSDPCGTVECCVDVGVLQRSIRFQIGIDPCTYTFTMGIEKLVFTRALVHYKWGTVEHFSLKDRIRLEFSIENLYGEKKFLVNMKAKICFEKDTCIAEFTVLDNVKIPKLVCDWESTTALTDFSLSDFLTEMKATSLTQLTQAIAARLFERLEIAGYLQNPQCNTGASPYTPATNGWKNDCPVPGFDSEYLPPLPSSLACHVTDQCTAIDCCVHIDFLSRSFHMFLFVDMCNYQLTVRVEQIEYTHMLFDYEWGKDDHFYVKGVIRIDFKIDRRPGYKQLEMTASLSVCLKQDDCLFNKLLLDKALIPQPLCDWDAMLNANDFSLSNWASGKGLSSALSSLTDTLISQLMNDLGITQFLNTPGCSQSDSLYVPADIKNWKKECSSAVVPSLPDSMRCNLDPTCSIIDCCANVPLLKRNIHARVHVDICKLELHLTIEKFTYDISLLEYEWGTTGQIVIGFMSRIEYTLEHDPSAQKLTVDVTIKVCFEKTACYLDVPVFSQSEIVYSPCNPSLPVPFKGVSFDFWKVEKCDLGSSTCSEPLPAPLQNVCQLTDNCMGITCCVDVDLDYLGVYTFSAGVMVDHCDDTLHYFIENKQWTKNLPAIDYDKNHTEPIGNAIDISYMITKTPTLYKVSLHLKICALNGHELTDKCYYFNIIDQMTFTMPSSCDPNKRRKRSSLNEFDKKNLKTVLSDALNKNFTNEQIDNLFKSIQEEERQGKLVVEDINADGAATNPRTALRKMGNANPGVILYSGEVGGGDVVLSMEGGEKIMKVLGKVSDVLGRSDQTYTVGKGLTGKGLKLLGAKLANMTIGEMMAMFDAKNIDPVLALRLTRQLRDLALALYSDIVDAIINGDAADTFGSFDLTLAGDFSFPRQSVTFFKYRYFFLIGGIVPMTFEFGAGASYGMGIIAGAKILGMTVFGEVIPYGSAHVYGEMGIGFILYGKLRFDGYLMNIAFPSRAEIGFYKFPLDLKLTMDMELVPLRMTLKGLVTLEINLIFKKIKKTLYSALIWQYSTPTVRKRLVDTGTKEEDKSPPQFLNYVDNTGDAGRKKRSISSTRNCLVRQLPGRDYTEPAVEVAVAAHDDRSQVQLYLDVGTKPGLSDVISGANLGGPSTIVTEKFKKHGVPMYITVFGENSAGTRTTVTCSIPTYDVTVPGGRLTADFRSTSNPGELHAHVVVYEDSQLVKSEIGVGLGIGIYADEIIGFNMIDLSQRDNRLYNPSTDNYGHIALEHFTGLKEGRLIGPVFAEFNNMNHAGSCVKECMMYPEGKCLSVNFDYGTSGHCELLEAIEGHHYHLAVSGQYAHFERIGVGLAYEFIYRDLPLLHTAMYYFNLYLKNNLGFESILHSEGVVVDTSPPEPGPMANVGEDYLEIARCEDLVPDQRPEWEDRCRGVDGELENHRIIHDGPGSMTLFNGDEALTDLLYTRANRYVSANWDGIHDKETGILGYSWTVGRAVCLEEIHPHHDPHFHLFHESEWTHTGIISPIPEKYDPLPDGKYYITLRAFNKVEYGGPLVTTICHTTPLGIDNSPPLMHDIYNITYDEDTFLITAMYNASDPESDIREIDLCLGASTRNCDHLDWTRSAHLEGVISRTYQIPGGTAVWVKLRAVNHVDLMRVGVADHPIIIDTSPPKAGLVYDGPVHKHDLNYTKDAESICANWFGFYDPESGISHYELTVLDEADGQIIEPVSFDHKTHETCVDIPSDKLLQHGKSYSFHVTAFNAGHKQLNVSAVSNGVIVDLTVPVSGEVVDGRGAWSPDLQFSTHVATVATQWRGFSDPESDIRDYEVKILRAKELSEDFHILKDWKPLGKEAREVEWHNFHLNHKDQVKTVLRATNNALGKVEQTTDGFVVDLTPPTMVFLGDGLEANKDTEYQGSDTTVDVNFAFVDDESGIDHYKYQVYEHYEGRKTQIYPATGWESFGDASTTTLTKSDLSLRLGALYSVRVGAVNRALAVAIYDSNGVKVDNTKPKISWLYVGILSGVHEHKVDDYVIQSDPEGIKATWFGTDHQSGIKAYMVAVGTTSGGTDVMDWMDTGPETDRYIDGLTLSVTDKVTNSPVYYVSVKAVNGAGLTSDVRTSSPILVVAEDKAGVVIDGADGTEGEFTAIGNDMDYQRNAGLVTAQFSGFESHEHGVTHYDWAVGTTPGGEEVQPFVRAGLVHRESETDVPGNGIASMGYAQAILPLVAGTKYFTTVRGITNNGNILQSTSDGFIVDQTPPIINFESFANEDNKTRLNRDTRLYQSETDSMSASWRVQDSETPIRKMYYTVGTHPYGEDVQARTEVEPLLTGEAALPTGIKPVTNGKPNILTLIAENEIGLTSRVISPSLIVDITPPTEGTITCPTFIQPHSPIECEWDGFYDEESIIEGYEFAVGSHEGLEDVVPPIPLSGNINKHLVHGLVDKVTHGKSYFAKIKATNAVGKSSSTISKAISVDITAPKPGRVVELSSTYFIDVNSDINTELLNQYKCNTEEECLSIDAVCQESLDTINIAWEAFTDEETEIVKYEVAVGTSPGGGQLKPYFEIEDITKRYMSITGLILKGERQVFVTVKGTNGAGLSSVSTSNGIYLSYLSQDMEPLTHVGVLDGNDENGDMNYQTSLTQMEAKWDVSGDPCPAVKYEWSIQRADGLVVQDYLDMGVQTHGVNDQLSMKNKEWYTQFLRVTNALDYTYTIRSNGITIEEDPLVPGQVNDGDVIGFDLQFLRTMTKISANWDNFGSDGLQEEKTLIATDAIEEDKPKSNQEIAFYEVAVGTDRRFHKTRYNIVPFTNVYLNKSVTFYDLELTPYRATYYFTVRAHSTSGSQTDVTSNGFSVGFDGGVEAGYINMQDFISADTLLDVQWDGFESKIGMMMYYVGVSDNTDAGDHKCGEFMERGSVSDAEIKRMFNVAEIRNVGEDTFMKFEDLALEQNGIYYAWVIGADQAGKCNMTTHRFQIDTTPPAEGQIRTGPYFGLKLGYSSVSDSMQVYWEGFSDEDSGLRCFHASLYRKPSCDEEAKEEIVQESIEIEASYSEYKFMALEMQTNVPYFARLVAENFAGSKTTVDSPPVLFDNSLPSSGVVIDGHDFIVDVSWIGTNSTVKGTFLHHPVPDESPCPTRRIPLDDVEWKSLESSRNYDSSNRSLTLTFRSANVHAESGKVDIKLARDPKERRMFSGSYYRDADLVNGGEYKMSIKAADGEGQAVTSVLFWNGPEDYILDYDYTPKPDWSKTNCACCLETPVNVTACKCNCERYLAAKEYYRNLQKRSTDDEPVEYEVRQLTEDEKTALRNKTSLQEKTHIGDPQLTPRKSCGLQLFSGSDGFTGRLVVWCSFGDYLNPSVETVRELSVDPSLEEHQYTVTFTRQMDEARGSEVTWCMYVYMDGREMSELCGIPRLSPDTKLYLGVWNHKNALPETGRDEEGHPLVWSTTATFSDLIIPPEKEKLCRYGNPFQGGNNAIVRYEAAIGSATGLSDVVDFTEVHSPCIPCLKPCDMYTCQSSCDASSTEQVQITLSGLNLPETTVIDGQVKPVLYYLTVKAVLGSGTSSVASSDGFNIDTSPPDFQEEVLLYIDVSQGEFTPVTYQGSNSTIKAVWKCEDIESEIVEYKWAIGLEPGGEDIQEFTSAGEFPGSSNTELEGVLQHNTTYYVTVQCRNGGGLTTTYADTKGVTVLLEPPVVDDVETAIEEAEPLGEDIVPANSMKTSDPHSVGASWIVPADPSVRRYDFGVGSRPDRADDIFPFTWVGYNESGTVAIKDGYLTRDGHRLYKLSQYKRNYNNESGDNPTDKSALTMPPGTEMFINMKLCNEADLCAVKLLGSTVVETGRSQVGTSHAGSRVRIPVPRRNSLVGSRRKRDVGDVLVETPGGLVDGQSILVTELMDANLQTEYRSDASVEFIPYITDPESTTEAVFLERILRQRVHYASTDTSFSVTSIGGLSLPGPLSVSFTFDPSKVNTTLMLLHWNPDVHQWQQSNKTCQYETDTEVRNEASSTVTVKVCDTRGKPNTDTSARLKRSVSDTYFRHPTQFLITDVLSEIPNDPPQLTSVTSLTMEEDTGVLIYQMAASDSNGDLFKFKLSPGHKTDDLDLVLSEDGLLTFEPAKDFNGRVTIPVTLYEVELVEITPEEVHVNFTIDVTAVNDPPEVFAFSNGTSILHEDPVHPVIILLEQIRVNDSLTSNYTWQFGVFDVDDNENITLFNTEFLNGKLTTETVWTSPRCNVESGLPCTDMSLPHFPSSLAWAYRVFNYEPDTDYFGIDEVRMYALDQHGVYSDVITLRMAVMERPCQNGGICESKQEHLYTCDDARRAEGFDLYYKCACAPGWSGIHCEDNVNECLSSPCSSPFVCYDKINSYVCACPDTEPNCDSFQAWMIALIVLAVILLIVISVICWYIFVLKRGRLRWSTLSDRLLGSSSGSGGSSFYNGGFEEEIWTDDREDQRPRSREYPREVSWVIYKGQKGYDGTGPMKHEGDRFRDVPMVRDRSVAMPQHDQATFSGESSNGANNARRSKYNMSPKGRSITPVEDLRPNSAEKLIKRRGPHKPGFTNEPAPDYDI